MWSEGRDLTSCTNHARPDSVVITAKPLSRIINTSLSQETVPEVWKNAKVTPLLNNGISTDMDNYRPIPVLPVVSKVLEKVVHYQLYGFLTEHKLLTPYQCGFRKSRSTETAAIALSDSIRRGMDQGLLTGAVFIDLRKAFDSVDHKILMNKQDALGAYTCANSWIKCESF